MKADRPQVVRFPSPQATMNSFRKAAKKKDVELFRDTISLDVGDSGLKHVLKDMEAAKKMMQKVVDTDFHLGRPKDGDGDDYQGFYYVSEGKESSGWADITFVNDHGPQGWTITDID